MPQLAPISTSPLAAPLPSTGVAPTAPGARPLEPIDAVAPPAPLPIAGPMTAPDALPSVGRPRKGTIAARVASALGTSREALEARRAGYAALIVHHEATIQSLETELAEIHRRIAQKTGDVRTLAAKKQHLASEISRNRGIASAAAAYGGLLGIFTLGASAAVGAGVAATAGVAIVKLSSDLSVAERAEREARDTLRELERSSAAFGEAHASARARVDLLRKERGAIDAAAPAMPENATAREVIGALQAGVAHDEKVIANLEAQIAVLRGARAHARGFEASLDSTIARLEKDVADLEARVIASRRAVAISFVDLALVGFGATLALRKAGLAISERDVLVAGIDLASGDLGKVAARVVENLISASLVAATDRPLLVETLGALTVAALAPADAKAKVAAVIAAAVKPLTAPQRAVLSRLEGVTTFDPEPLARAVVESSVSRSEAAAVARILDRA